MKERREIEAMSGLTRRMIQEYIKMGLGNSPQMNSKGQYYYEDDTVDKLWQASFLRNLKFTSNDEITQMVNNPDYVGETVEDHLNKLIEERKEYDKAIDVMSFMKTAGLNISSIYRMVMRSKDLTASDAFDFIYLLANQCMNFSEEQNDNLDDIEDDEFFAIFDILEKIATFYPDGSEFSDTIVQNEVKRIHTETSKLFSPSVYGMIWFIVPFLSDMEIKEYFEKEFGSGVIKFVFDAIEFYSQQNKNNEFDRKISKYIEDIADLNKRGLQADSKETQNKIKLFVEEIGEESIPAVKENLENMIATDSDAFLVNALGENITSYILKAIDIYFNKITFQKKEKRLYFIKKNCDKILEINEGFTSYTFYQSDKKKGQRGNEIKEGKLYFLEKEKESCEKYWYKMIRIASDKETEKFLDEHLDEMNVEGLE